MGVDTVTMLRWFLLSVILLAFFSSSSCFFRGIPRNIPVGRGNKWNLDSKFEGPMSDFKQVVDEKLNTIVATDDYIEDLENKIQDLEEEEAKIKEELNEEMLEDDEDYEGSGRPVGIRRGSKWNLGFQNGIQSPI